MKTESEILIELIDDYYTVRDTMKESTFKQFKITSKEMFLKHIKK